MKEESITIEICAEGVRSALAAAEGGADCVELCENIASGGVTPSAGAIGVVCQELSIPVHVLIRPRAGDFVYSGAEFEAMRRDIDVAGSHGARGVVIGLLGPDGGIDRDRTADLVSRARPLAVTFHKAIDEARDLLATLDQLAELGIDRVLSSGQASSARDGLDRLRQLRCRADGRVRVVAGGRIRDDDLAVLIAAGFRELHIGSGACVDGLTSPARVRQICGIARGSP